MDNVDIKVCEDCGYDGALEQTLTDHVLERSASGRMMCADMIACLYREQVKWVIEPVCRFCGRTEELEKDGSWIYCADRSSCGLMVTSRLHKKVSRKRRMVSWL